MSSFDACYHSPFSRSNVRQGTHCSLLLQFLLDELFQAIAAFSHRAPVEALFVLEKSPFYSLLWSSPTGHINKLSEHAQLLDASFPHDRDTTSIFSHALENTRNLLINYIEHRNKVSDFEVELASYLKQMFSLLEPLMYSCKHDENFIYFLLRHKKQIALLSHPQYLALFLEKSFPQGLDHLCEIMCDHFHARGFASTIPEVKQAISELKDG